MRYLKKIFNTLFSRLFLVGLMLALQLAALFSAAMYFSQTALYVYFLFNALSVIAALGAVSVVSNSSYKVTWVISILIFPSVGWLFYLLFGNKRMPKKLQEQIDASFEDTREHMPPGQPLEGVLAGRDKHLALQSRYIYNIAGYPVMKNSGAEYFPVGELMYERMLEELRRAERFIFLEYFIIRPGVMWDTIFAILREKASQGVEVRLMYDDLGSINTLPRRYNRMIRDAGIRLHVFNPFRPRVSVILNHRDHRKMTVIDGRVAFCGGINLADEYINQYERFGHWKDTGVLVRGDAVWSFTFMFLQQWRFGSEERIDFEQYLPPETPPGEVDGLVQPFGESPLDSVNVTETAYLNIIQRATRYVYITTPYLVIDDGMEQALCSAAQTGIDVRIITPYIYDKWYVHMLTRSHYQKLISAGVKVYEYTPGFMHGKMFVSDDNVCMVGTCNMDFRSFYLHFECSVAFYHAGIVARVKEDMLACQEVSHRITVEDTQKIRLPSRMLRAVLKVFAPLM